MQTMDTTIELSFTLQSSYLVIIDFYFGIMAFAAVHYGIFGNSRHTIHLKTSNTHKLAFTNPRTALTNSHRTHNDKKNDSAFPENIQRLLQQCFRE